MNGPELLQEAAGRLRTRMGAFRPGQPVIFRGHELHTDLKDAAWLDLFVFGITGRRLSTEQLRLIDAIWAYTSYPDARIWNNRVVALAGTTRSTGALGLAAGLALSDAAIYGGGPIFRSLSFLRRARTAIESGRPLAECIDAELAVHGHIAGYGRPITADDERIKPIMDCAAGLGLADGPHVGLAFEVEADLVRRRPRWRMNYAAIIAAFGADLGFSPHEYYLCMFPILLAGMPPCYIESEERAEGALFPLPCTQINYEGPSPRKWRTSGSASQNLEQKDRS